LKNWMPDWLLNKAHAAKRNVFINELHDLEHERAFHEISDDYAHTNAMAYARKLVLESNVDSKGESK